YPPVLRPDHQAAIGPEQRLAVDVLLEQPFAQHQAEILASPAPGRVGGFVNDVAQVVQPAGVARLAFLHPALAALPTLPGARSEAEDLDLDGATLERAGQDVAAHRGHRDWAPAHRAGIVDQQRDHRVAE